MWALVLNFIFAAWVLYDSSRRGGSSVGYAVLVFLFGPFALPFYFAKRPLLDGEVREGGFGWNVCKNFALFWTVFMAVATFAGFVAASGAAANTQNEYEAAGAALGTMLGVGVMGALWFFPTVGALVLGLLLKKSSIVEHGSRVAKAA